MSSSIAVLMYGIPLISDGTNQSPLENEVIFAAVESYLPGIVTGYSGWADETPTAFGIRVETLKSISPYSRLPEINLNDLDLQYKNLLENTPEEFRKELEELGQPHVFVLWTTT